MAGGGFASRFKVGTRIYGGFSCVLVLLVVVSAVGYWGLTSASSAFKIYADIADDAAHAKTVQTLFANIRRNVVFYTERAEGEEDARRLMNNLKPQLAKVLQGANDATERTNAERIISYFNGYAEDFDKLVKLRRERDSLINGGLAVDGAKVRQLVTDIAADALRDGRFEESARVGQVQETFLLARLSASRFVATPSDKQADEAKARIRQFQDGISQLRPRLSRPQDQDRLARIAEGAGAYAAAFDKAVAVTDAIASLVYGDMVGKAKAINQLADANSDNMARSQDEIEKTTDAGIGRSTLLALIFSVTALLVGGLCARLIAGSIIRPVESVRKVMADLSEGHLDVVVPHTDATDELGEMARTVDVFKAVSVAAVRAGAGLDRVSASVMMADTAGIVTYVNPSLTRLFERAESDIRTQIPAFAANDLLGKSFDLFHKDPRHQRRLIDGLTGTHESTFTIGRRTFRIVANPVVSRLGARLGTVVEWQDLTDELAVEEEIKTVVAAAVKGDLSRRIPLEGKTGFFRAISQGINDLGATVSEVSEELADMLEALAGGNLGRRIERRYEGLFQRLKNDYNATADKLAEVVRRIGEATNAIGTAASEVSAGSADLAERTEQQASSLEETAAAMEEMGATVRRNADNAGDADRMASSTKQAAEQGGVLAGSAVDAMRRIEEASRKITDIIGVIDEIAFQTNLLALNAAVEAARAGDAGKGFAVVAQEVRVLAQRSAQASKEIKALILASDGQVRDGVDMVRKAGAALGGIADGVNKVAAVIADISSASGEQASALDEINSAVAGLDEMTQKNAALVEETAAAAQSMAEQAGQLKDLMSFFITDASGAGSLARHVQLVEGTKMDHVAFRKRVDDAVTGTGDATADSLPDHHHCRLGKWYDGLSDATIRRLPSFAAIERPHAAVHDAAREALRSHAAGDQSNVRRALGTMTENSQALMGLLDRLASDIKRQEKSGRRRA